MYAPSTISKSLPAAAGLAVLAASLAHAGNFVRAAWKARRHRRAVVALLHVDDHMLADIGLTRGDVHTALAGAAFDDPSMRLKVVAVERRAARREQQREWWDAEARAASATNPARASV